MHHARIRSTQDRRLVAAVTLSVIAIAVTACTGTAAAPAATQDPVSVRASERATPAPTAPDRATTPAPASPVVTPSPESSTFESPVYGYTIELPDGSEVTSVVPATSRWGGASEIGSTAPFVDQFHRNGQRLAFILSAPTGLDLDGYAKAIHAKAVREHGCSEEFTDTREFEIDGSPARVVAFACQGLRVYEATTVRDGIGLIAKQITPPPGSPDLEKASLDDFLWFLEPFAWGR
jgi:hypothetical protein